MAKSLTFLSYNWISSLSSRSHLSRRTFICSLAMPATQLSQPNNIFELDRESFQQSLQFYAVRIPPKLCNGTRKLMKQHSLLIPRVQSVRKISTTDSPASTLLLLKYLAQKPVSQHKHAPYGNADDSLINTEPEKIASILNSIQIASNTPTEISSFVNQLSAENVTSAAVHIKYEQWSVEAILKELIPEEIVIPSSFETVGHLVHLNLRDEHQPYKKVIGTVLLDKLKPRIKTVINKLGSTGGPYRTFAMEVLAGEDNTVTKVKQNGCTFSMDFAKVYWNSRLEHEHKRIVNMLKPDDILVDAFCGIGPFVVPAAKKNVCKAIYANDLNPDSVKYLQVNMKQNGVEEGSINVSKGCARECLRKLRDNNVKFTRLVMNFPAGAPEFLDTFQGLYYGSEKENTPMPIVHCYCFVKDKAEKRSARIRVRRALFGEGQGEATLPDEKIDVREIRDVAPNKIQVCVTFTIPREVAFKPPTQDPSPSSPKRQRTT